MTNMTAPLEHIILIPNQHVFALSQKWCVLKGEASKTTRGEHANDYTTDAIVFCCMLLMKK
jgi:hypothetical protein